MRMPKPQPRRREVAEVQQQLPELLDAVVRGGERVIIERDGRPVAALISLQDVEWLQETDLQLEYDRAVLQASWDAFRDVSPEEGEREVAKALAEVREEERQRRQKAQSA